MSMFMFSSVVLPHVDRSASHSVHTRKQPWQKRGQDQESPGGTGRRREPGPRLARPGETAGERDAIGGEGRERAPGDSETQGCAPTCSERHPKGRGMLSPDALREKNAFVTRPSACAWTCKNASGRVIGATLRHLWHLISTRNLKLEEPSPLVI